MKTCPACGFIGVLDNCPIDGAQMVIPGRPGDVESPTPGAIPGRPGIALPPEPGSIPGRRMPPTETGIPFASVAFGTVMAAPAFDGGAPLPLRTVTIRPKAISVFDGGRWKTTKAPWDPIAVLAPDDGSPGPVGGARVTAWRLKDGHWTLGWPPFVAPGAP